MLLPEYHYSWHLSWETGCPDVVINCRDGTLTAHRGLLAVHSAMFSEMFSSLENVEENGSFVVVLPDTNLEDLQNIFKALHRPLVGIEDVLLHRVI